MHSNNLSRILKNQQTAFCSEVCSLLHSMSPFTRHRESPSLPITYNKEAASVYMRSKPLIEQHFNISSLNFLQRNKTRMVGQPPPHSAVPGRREVWPQQHDTAPQQLTSSSSSVSTVTGGCSTGWSFSLWLILNAACRFASFLLLPVPVDRNTIHNAVNMFLDARHSQILSTAWLPHTHFIFLLG